MSPLGIEILLHYYTRIDDFPDWNWPAQLELQKYFLAESFLARNILAPDEITTNAPCFVITDKGRVYCEALCALPSPEWIPGKWEMPS